MAQVLENRPGRLPIAKRVKVDDADDAAMHVDIGVYNDSAITSTAATFSARMDAQMQAAEDAAAPASVSTSALASAHASASLQMSLLAATAAKFSALINARSLNTRPLRGATIDTRILNQSGAIRRQAQKAMRARAAAAAAAATKTQSKMKTEPEPKMKTATKTEPKMKTQPKTQPISVAAADPKTALESAIATVEADMCGLRSDAVANANMDADADADAHAHDFDVSTDEDLRQRALAQFAAALRELLVMTMRVREELEPWRFSDVQQNSAAVEMALRAALWKHPGPVSTLTSVRDALWTFLMLWPGAPQYVLDVRATGVCIEPSDAVCTRWNARAAERLTPLHARLLRSNYKMYGMVHPVCARAARLACHVALLRMALNAMARGSIDAKSPTAMDDVTVFAATSVFIDITELVMGRRGSPQSDPAPVPAPVSVSVSALPPDLDGSEFVHFSNELLLLCPHDLPTHYVSFSRAIVAAFVACSAAARHKCLRAALSWPRVAHRVSVSLRLLADAASSFLSIEDDAKACASASANANAAMPATAAERYGAFARLRQILNALLCADLMPASFWTQMFVPLVRSVEASLRSDANFGVNMCMYIRNLV